MASVRNYTSASVWTAVDLVHRFGAIPLHRVVDDPAPGTATVADVVRLNDHDNRLCELIDGTLVEKTIVNISRPARNWFGTSIPKDVK